MPTQPAALGTLTSGWSLGGLDPYQFGLTIKSATIRDMPPVMSRQEERPGGHGNVVYPEHYAPRPVILQGQMVADTVAQLQSNWDELKTVLNTFRVGEPRTLRVIDGAATDRFYSCHYAGQATIGEIGPRLLATHTNVTISLMANPPFAQAVTPTETNFVGTAGTFQTITTGDFESPCRIVLKGDATNPSLIFGDSIYICDFNLTTDFTNASKTATGATFSGTAAQEAGLFSPSSAGFGHAFLLNGAYTLSNAVVGNKDAGSWFVIVEPQFDSTNVAARTIFEHRFDANNRIRLRYINSGVNPDLDRKFVLIKEVAGAEKALWSTEQDFVSGDVLKIGLDYGSSGMRLFIAGSLDASNVETTGMSSNPDTLSFNDSGSNFSANMKIHYAAGWSSQLTTTEHSLIASDPVGRIRNDNQVLTYTGSLATGDLLEFTNEDDSYVGKLLDVSAGGAPTTVFPDSGTQIPNLAAENTSVYVSSAAANVYIQHRNRFL